MIDVTVFGGGIFGLSIAFACARRGAKVRLVEAEEIGAGASGGIVGALAPHVPEQWNEKKAFQLESLLMAEAWWAEIARIGGANPGYARTGRLQPVEGEAAMALAQARKASAAAIWGDAAIWELREAADFPAWGLAQGPVIHDTLCARISPRAALAALVAAVERLGGTIVTQTGTQNEAMAEGRVVWATGAAGLDAISASLGRNVGAGIKGQAIGLRFEGADLPQLYAHGLHIVPHFDGSLAIGSTTERDFKAPRSTDARCDELFRHAVAACPMLASATIVERWAGLRPRARSRSPMLGAWPGKTGHFIANGGFKIGFGMAPKVAEVMADLVLDGRDRIPQGFGVAANL